MFEYVPGPFCATVIQPSPINDSIEVLAIVYKLMKSGGNAHATAII